ncbi:MAG: hypothetical protein JWP81_4878 [Ferruginibacter sp.]|nr:hypothetical protein [Ferruginibacter sp.]
MPRIGPLSKAEIKEPVEKVFEQHVTEFNSRITNMKATLGHSLLAFEVYMKWYPLYNEVKNILRSRLAYLYAYSISHSTDCLLCTTFFRKIIIDSGENPEHLKLSPQEQHVINFGGAIAAHKANIANRLYKSIFHFIFVSVISDVTIFAIMKISVGLCNFSFSVHHKRPPGCNGFCIFFTSKYKNVDPSF